MLSPTTLLHDFVAIPSLSGEETAAAEYLVTQMAALGFANTHVDPAGNAVGERSQPDDSGAITRTIVLLGHMDTVPGDIPVRIEDGILHGRGSVDAKGPLATFVMAVAQATIPAGTRLVVVGATEEESATSKGARYAVDQYRPEFCIIGEPSGWDGVTLGYKGRVLIDYRHAQSMSHTAGQDSGSAESGIAWLNQVSAEIERFNADQTRLFDQLLPSIRHIHTGSDGLTNTIDIKLGVRLPPDFDLATFEEKLRAWGGDSAEIELYGYEKAYQSGRGTPLARAFNRTLRQRGVRPRFKLKTGTSDMNVVGPVWNCPIVAYGPGDSSLDHTPEEHIVLEEYQQAIDILKEVLEQEF